MKKEREDSISLLMVCLGRGKTEMVISLAMGKEMLAFVSGISLG